MVDRYTRVILSVIAAALVYLCVVLSPFPTAVAQTAKRPGDPTGPAEVVIVGWRPAPSSGDTSFPVRVVESVALDIDDVRTTVRVAGLVQTEQSANAMDRVVISGWEQGTAPRSRGSFRSLTAAGGDQVLGLPVTQTPSPRQ